MTRSKVDKIMVADTARVGAISTAGVEVAGTAGVELPNIAEMELANTAEMELANTAEVEVEDSVVEASEISVGLFVAETVEAVYSRSIYSYPVNILMIVALPPSQITLAPLDYRRLLALGHRHLFTVSSPAWQCRRIPLQDNAEFLSRSCRRRAPLFQSSCCLWESKLHLSLADRSMASPRRFFSQSHCRQKVHKQGVALGRSVELTKFDGYGQLIEELDQLFEFKGELMAPNKNWMIVFTDNEDDMMLVGDDPWQEFCAMVCKIFIYTKEEVQKMDSSTLNPKNEDCPDMKENVKETKGSQSASSSNSKNL
ncbi:hypothetical protein ZIOFF_000952 [Zingiber officinale]|uniref:Auxin-responsive protein n=1 Tax=Zingiber officinale TaxID=94328 RepID=A0A8J5LY55_ZINOF|nr:hypothetical protein ZIOFF_000952 [Zingiber officinale]